MLFPLQQISLYTNKPHCLFTNLNTNKRIYCHNLEMKTDYFSSKGGFGVYKIIFIFHIELCPSEINLFPDFEWYLK